MLHYLFCKNPDRKNPRRDRLATGIIRCYKIAAVKFFFKQYVECNSDSLNVRICTSIHTIGCRKSSSDFGFTAKNTFQSYTIEHTRYLVDILKLMILGAISLHNYTLKFQVFLRPFVRSSIGEKLAMRPARARRIPDELTQWQGVG